MKSMLLKLFQSVLVKEDGSQFHSGINEEVTGREEMMKGKTDFWSWPVMLQCLATDVIRPNTIFHDFSEIERAKD